MKCQYCKKERSVERFHQGTQYVDEAQNWTEACKPCKKAILNHWSEMFADYYANCL